MFLNVDEANHIYLSTTRTYMALQMVSPMAMIPHLSSAILLSKNSNLKDPEVIKLSKGIIASQEKINRRNESHFNKDEKINQARYRLAKTSFKRKMV